MAKRTKKTASLYHPKYWSAWIIVSLLGLWARLPWRMQWIVARIMSIFMTYAAPRRRHIVETNLRLCFPELNIKQHQQMVKDTLFNNMLGLVETAIAYSRPVEQWHYEVEFEGLEVLHNAVEQERGVLLLGAHYSHLDAGGALVAQVCEVNAIYRTNNNPVFDRHIQAGRRTFLKGAIERNNMRGMIKALKNNEIVWYPPDQDYGHKHSVYAPFFGVNAATITATSRLASFRKSPVVMLACHRDDDNRCYRVAFIPGPSEFPSGDEAEDARLINAALENCIRRAPEQYMWTHRRFKTQPSRKKAELYR